MKWTGSESDADAAFKRNMSCLGKDAPIFEMVNSEEKKVVLAKKAPAPPKSKPVRKPSKVLKYGRLWEVYDYGEEELVFKESEVKLNMLFNFHNCVKTTVRIEGKCS